MVGIVTDRLIAAYLLLTEDLRSSEPWRRQSLLNQLLVAGDPISGLMVGDLLEFDILRCLSAIPSHHS